MKKVFDDLSPFPKSMAKLHGVWGIFSGYDRPRYVDSKTLRSGYLAMDPWGDSDIPVLTATAGTSTLNENYFYTVEIVAEDHRFASTSSVWRRSNPTDRGTPVKPGAGQKIVITVPTFSQQGYDNSGPTQVEDDECTHRKIYLAVGSDADEALTAPARLIGIIANNTTTTWDLLNGDYLAEEAPSYDMGLPPNCKMVVSDFNRMWAVGGIEENRGRITVLDSTVTGNTSGDNQTYFTEGMVGAEITIADEKSYSVESVDVANQVITLASPYTGLYNDGVSTVIFQIQSNYGLYWSAVDHPHWWPLNNYIPIPGRPTAVTTMSRSIFVFAEDGLFRFSADAPEQGYLRIGEKTGTIAPESIVEAKGLLHYYDGNGFSMTDGVQVTSLTYQRYRELGELIDRDNAWRIVGGWDERTRMIHWYFPTADRPGNHNGLMYQPDTGDIYPVKRMDVSTLWEEDGKLMMGNSGRYAADGTAGIWELVPDQAGDGISSTDIYRGTVDASSSGQTVVITREGSQAFSESLVNCPVTIRISDTIDWSGIVSSASHDGTTATLTVHSDFTVPALSGGESAFIGVIPSFYGVKWFDFGSPRYLHKVYDLAIAFLPMAGDVDIAIDWYSNMNEAPIKTTNLTIAAGETMIQVPFRDRSCYQFGFRLRVFGRETFNIQSYTVTWDTIR